MGWDTYKRLLLVNCYVKAVISTFLHNWYSTFSFWLARAFFYEGMIQCKVHKSMMNRWGSHLGNASKVFRQIAFDNYFQAMHPNHEFHSLYRTFVISTTIIEFFKSDSNCSYLNILKGICCFMPIKLSKFQPFDFTAMAKNPWQNRYIL